VAQVIFDSLVRSSELALLAVGLTMVYSVLRFPNFSHVEFAPLGAYLALVFTGTLGLPLVLAAVVAVVLTGAAGVACDRAVFARLRTRSPIMLMIAAFALGIVIREVLRAIFGPSPTSFPIGLQAPLQIMGASVTPVQIGIILAAVACMLAFHLLLTYTNLGIAMRAAADNADLARASGIHTERVIRAVWFIGSGFAGLGGILLGLDTQIFPMMGFGIIIPVFCAAILGGIGSPYGALLGALVLGFAENVGLSINFAGAFEALGMATDGYVYIPSGYKAAIPFTFLILALLLRPQGLVGRRSG
jgi:branched-subunit amino acid ABC-type transport system permease component